MYEKFYGFSECPFSIAPDPRFLYMASGHFEAFSSMLSGVKEGKGITVITGKVGVGKTTLIRALLKDLDEKIKVSFIFFTRLTFPEMLRQILTDLGQPVNHDDELLALLQTFYRYLAERRENNERVAIIIDEAQVLEKGVLEDVARLVSRPNPSSDVLRIILVGQPEFEGMIDRHDLTGVRSQISLRRDIRPLTMAESSAYIDHRLRVVGSRTNSVFAPEAVEKICAFAQGIPRVINMVCDAAFVDGYAKHTKLVGEKTIKGVIKELSHLEALPAKPQHSRKPSPRAAKSTRAKSRYKPLVASGAVAASALIVALFLLGVSRTPQTVVPVNEPSHTEGLTEKTVVPKPETERTERIERTTAPAIKADKGATLTRLVGRRYGQASPTIIDMVLEANPYITDIDLIYESQEIVMPPLSGKSFVLSRPDNRYVVCLGTYPNRPPTKPFEDEAVLKGKTIELVPRRVSSHQTWYRVVAGPFSTREEGVKAFSALQREGVIPVPPAAGG